MKIHEYQGKQLFQRYGIPTPKGYPAFTAAEVEQGAKKLIDETKIPVVIGAGGVEKIIEIELSASEKAMLKTSADSVQKVVDIVKAKS